MSIPQVLLPACANWNMGEPPCQRQGKNACGNCKLVVYCGSECQQAHWESHKKVCRSSMGKDSWRPAWDGEGRVPPWAMGTAAKNWHNPFGENKYLWGNTPAVDVLRLEQNEGLGYQEDISLLFAASGDLRHVVKTIASLPDGMSQHIGVTMNDREFTVTARNAILLLLPLTALDASISSTSIAEAMIHVWYSVSIPQTVHSLLQNNVKPLITEVCTKIASKPANTCMGKTWKFSGGRSLRLVLKQKEWLQLGNFLDMPKDLSFEDAMKIRKSVTFAPQRADYWDRWFFKDSSPFTRLAKQRFREDGLLLPFGHPRTAFTIANPTFFQDPGKWPLNDTASPSDGWPVMDIHRISSSAANDWYGKLFNLLHKMLDKFLNRLAGTRATFVLYNLDVIELPQHLEEDTYARVEVANICDGGYLGIRHTLSLLSALLQSPQQNPHATFLTLFINAVKEILKRGNPIEAMPHKMALFKYLPFPRTSSPNDADMIRTWDALNLGLDISKPFEKYMRFCNFAQIAADLHVEMKEINTVTEMWPTRMKLAVGDKGAEEEFRLHLGSGCCNVARYVEWRRVE